MSWEHWVSGLQVWHVSTVGNNNNNIVIIIIIIIICSPPDSLCWLLQLINVNKTINEVDLLLGFVCVLANLHSSSSSVQSSSSRIMTFSMTTLIHPLLMQAVQIVLHGAELFKLNLLQSRLLCLNKWVYWYKGRCHATVQFVWGLKTLGRHFLWTLCGPLCQGSSGFVPHNKVPISSLD